MHFFELFLLAIALSMDAFAVAVCNGLTMKKITVGKALTVGLYYGVFQGGMPLIGFYIARLFANRIMAFDHWIAFILLGAIGGNMIRESLKKEGCSDRICPDGMCTDRSCPGGDKPDVKEAALSPMKMLPLAIATSIDALAVGVSFAFLKVNIVPAVLFIGVVTLIISMIGVKIGHIFGLRFKAKAELAGGCILILIGLRILLAHFGIFG